MTIVFSPDGFKGTLSAARAARALAEGWRSVDPTAKLCEKPMADGGEGTLDAFAASVGGATRMPITVDGPDGRPVDTEWLFLPPGPDAPRGTGVVELANTSGIELLGGAGGLRPFDAHTVGFGQAIAAAIDHGVSRLVLGIGSSASTDGGAGILLGLGATITAADGEPLERGARGLAAVDRLDLTTARSVPERGALVLTDVTNPLLGARGAAAVFGPQKGATAEDIPLIEQALTRWVEVVGADPSVAGAGAAGGAGFGLLVWGAQIVPGALEIARIVGLREVITDASLVVTGEGSYDGTSEAGKAPAVIAALAREAAVPCVLVAGRIAPDADKGPFEDVVSLTVEAGSSEAAMNDPERWLAAAGARLARRAAEAAATR